MAGNIHPTALVSPEAELAEGVEVGAYAVIGAGVQVGANTRVGPHAVIQGPARIGADNQIFQFASVGSAPQDKKYKGEPTRLEIGDRNVIRECVTLNRGTVQDQGVTRIGNDNLFMAYAHVAHDCQIGNHCILANSATLGGHVQLGDWVIMGGLSGIHQFCKVGAHAFIANNAAVTRDVPPYVMAVGQPAAAHSVNSEGLKRRGFTPDQVRNIRNAFRVLYRSGLKLADAQAQLAALVQEQPELAMLVEFLPQSTRSIVR
jgi:UDP-N-acetylglucosamine acyltransferase